jgi:hypothetical protein
MASDAINPAVPGPADPPDANAPGRPAGGLIASVLAPVAVARPTFDLTAPAGADGATDAAVTGVSSAAFHGTEETTQQDSKTAASSAQKKGIWRAWMLAGAARWGKGGGTQNKRLDMKKAKAQAQQVKETRTVTINRTPAPLGKGSSNAGSKGSGNKSLNSKGNSGGAVKGPQNSNGKAHQGPAGRSGGSAGTGPGGSGGRGPSGGRTANGPSGRDRNASPKGPKTDASGGRTPKQEKTSLTKGGTTNSPKGMSGGSAGGKKGAPGPAGSPGKSGGTGTSGSGGSKGSGSGWFSSSKNGKAPTGKDTKQAPTQGDKAAKGKDAKTTPAPASAATDPAKAGGKTKVNLLKRKRQTPDAAGQKTSPDTPANGKRFSTRESRETGYRDGTRAAKVAAHTKAYRDGVKDGWADTTQAADREKARLDQAHQTRKQARDEEKPVPGTQSSADYHQPEPIGVKEVTATHIVLGDGAAKDSVTRGEVRTLKSFERRLTEKSNSMTKVAEMTKGMQAHAEEQAKKATKLLEDAKAVKGGEKLAGTLARMEEAAKIQADKAKEIHKRAVRAAEACAVVLTNVETRYGGMYKAVVDSDETAPAELHFYKDQG